MQHGMEEKGKKIHALPERTRLKEQWRLIALGTMERKEVPGKMPGVDVQREKREFKTAVGWYFAYVKNAAGEPKTSKDNARWGPKKRVNLVRESDSLKKKTENISRAGGGKRTGGGGKKRGDAAPI